ncbi:MAG: hypothetical protein LBL13_10085, partial [Bacteroidales bacterium]|jgi:hypothetical protein|nr:hypothetical protein [Bacteroidales bacterium]
MNFIQQYYLKRQLNSFVAKRTEKQKSIRTLKESHSVCFFLTYDTSDKLEELIRYISLQNKKGKIIICYLPSGKIIENKIDTTCVHLITQKAIKATGKLDKQVLENIFSQHYNIFIDVDIKPDLSSLYLKSFLDADFRIGRNSEYYKYYDFTLCVNERYTIKEYINNVETYISKLKGNL